MNCSVSQRQLSNFRKLCQVSQIRFIMHGYLLDPQVQVARISPGALPQPWNVLRMAAGIVNSVA
jgi:hypothetical protein